MTLREQIMNLQTYKMYEGEDTIYVERDEVLKLLEQQTCEYKPLIIDKPKDEDMLELLRTFQNQKVLVAEHDCSPSVTLLAEPCDDCISRTALLEKIDEERKHLLDLKMDGAEHIIVHHARRIIEDMPSVTPKASED